MNLSEIPPEKMQDHFLNCFIDILSGRLDLIRNEFDDEVFSRTLNEMKMVQIYHQAVLKRFDNACDDFRL